MLWVDKHRPNCLSKLDYHANLSSRLEALVRPPVRARAARLSHAHHHVTPAQAADGDLPHLLFYGPQGAGKKTRIMALLRAIYGSGCEKACVTYVARARADERTLLTARAAQVKLEHRSFKSRRHARTSR